MEHDEARSCGENREPDRSADQIWSVVFGVLLLRTYGLVGVILVSVPERSKGVDSSSTVFALVGSNPTADTVLLFCFFASSHRAVYWRGRAQPATKR